MGEEISWDRGFQRIRWEPLDPSCSCGRDFLLRRGFCPEHVRALLIQIHAVWLVQMYCWPCSLKLSWAAHLRFPVAGSSFHVPTWHCPRIVYCRCPFLAVQPCVVDFALCIRAK